MSRLGGTRYAVIAATLGLIAPAIAEPLSLEWADQARDRKAIGGDPVYIRTLYCEEKQGPTACDMTVVVVSREFCPLVLQIYSFRTEANNLRAHRSGDVLNVEITDPHGVTKLRIGLMTDLIGQKIVQHASGVITFHAMGDEAVRASELIAFARNSKGMEKYPEHLEVDLHCSKVSVVAAKKDAK